MYIENEFIDVFSHKPVCLVEYHLPPLPSHRPLAECGFVPPPPHPPLKEVWPPGNKTKQNKNIHLQTYKQTNKKQKQTKTNKQTTDNATNKQTILIIIHWSPSSYIPVSRTTSRTLLPRVPHTPLSQQSQQLSSMSGSE